MPIYHLQTNIAGLLRNCTTRKLGLLFDMPGSKANQILPLDSGVDYKKTKGGYDIRNFRKWEKTGAGWELMYKNQIYVGEVHDQKKVITVYFDKYGRVSNRHRADCDVDINAT